MPNRSAVRLAILSVIATAIGCGDDRCGELGYRYPSPDGRFEIVVCRQESVIPVIGTADDKEGLVQLRATESGQVIASAHIDMVSMMTSPVWTSDHVWVPLIAEWQLPAVCSP